jgi:hypothetical protein
MVVNDGRSNRIDHLVCPHNECRPAGKGDCRTKARRQALSAWPEAQFKNSAGMGEEAACSVSLVASRHQAAKTPRLAAGPTGINERIHDTKLAEYSS